MSEWGVPNKAEEGRQAYKDGLPREQNPYRQGSARYWQWSSGWLDEQAFRPRADRIEALERELKEAQAEISDLIDKWNLAVLATQEVIAERDAAEASLARLSEALRGTTVSLVAAVSLLKRGSKKAAPSNKMFDQMILDYEKSIEEARAALSGSGSVATHRHKKRGNEYVLLGYGRMQSEWWKEEEPYPPGSMSSVDMREVAIYRSIDDGLLWARPCEEFNDGRFEPLPSVLSELN